MTPPGIDHDALFARFWLGADRAALTDTMGLAEYADLMGVHYTTVYNMIQAGAMPVPVNRRAWAYRIPRAAVTALLERRKGQTVILAVGDRVTIDAYAFRDGATGIVTATGIGAGAFTVTVRYDRDGEEYPFKPSELERITEPHA